MSDVEGRDILTWVLRIGEIGDFRGLDPRSEDRHTDQPRYNILANALGGVIRRLLICGMHVHVGIEDPDTRVDLLNQVLYFVPHMLALSTSSPFWKRSEG